MEATLAFLKPSSEKEGDHSQRFRTYYHYFSAWRMLFEDRHGHVPSCPLKVITANPRYSNLYRGGSVSPQVELFLHNAWSTEIILRLPLSLDALETGKLMSTYSCAWAPVQAYYSVFSALVAAGSAEGQEIRDHANALTFASKLVETQCWVPDVFSYWCRGYESLKNVSYAPSMPSCCQVSNLRFPADREEAVALVKKCLKTTRADICAERIDEERAKKRRTKAGATISKVRKMEIDGKLRVTTLFDFLYRVRCRCNYRDTDTFIRGAMIDGTSNDFLDAVSTVASHSLAFLETLICGRIGKQAMIEMVTKYFLEANASCAYVPVASRWGVDF